MRQAIEQAGAVVLRARAAEVPVDEIGSPAIQELIDLMLATVRGAGVGLAAPQVGVSVRVVVIEDLVELHANVPDDLLAAQGRAPVDTYVLVNPELTVTDPTEAEFFEGCLSVEGYSAVVPRSRAVRVRARDREGNRFELDATGWHARILQHEVDHLDGVLYIDRMRSRSFVTAESYVTKWRSASVDDLAAAFGPGPARR